MPLPLVALRPLSQVFISPYQFGSVVTPSLTLSGSESFSEVCVTLSETGHLFAFWSLGSRTWHCFLTRIVCHVDRFMHALCADGCASLLVLFQEEDCRVRLR